MTMKSKIKVLVFLFAVFFASATFSQKASAQQPYVSFQVFYDELSPFGEWVNYPNWGYVWIPDAGNDFVPYSSDGHWIFLTMAGPGCRIIAGDGLPFIMAAGISIIITAGSGYREMNGVLHGYRGEEPKDIMDGHQWNPVLVSQSVLEGDMTVIMIIGYL